MDIINPQPSDPTNQENKTVCDTLNRNYTQFHHAKYGGIPQAFILNVTGAALLIVVFSLLRRRAGDYARLALNHDTWNELFWEDQLQHLTDIQSNSEIQSRSQQEPMCKSGDAPNGRHLLKVPPASLDSGFCANGVSSRSSSTDTGAGRGGVIEAGSPNRDENLITGAVGVKRAEFKLSREELAFRSVDADDIEEIDPTSSKYLPITDQTPKGSPASAASETNNNNNQTVNSTLTTTSGENIEVIGDKGKVSEPAAVPLCKPHAKPTSTAAVLAHRSSRLLRLESPRRQDDGFFSWIMVTIRLSDAQYRERVGPDSVQYLTFQRYLIGVVLCVCPISLIVMLPINLLGSNLDNRADPLAFTTISNLGNHSLLLFVPSVFCVIYIAIILAFMKHFTDNMPFKSQFKTNAVMITNINVHKSNHSPVTAEDVHSYLTQLYPELRLEVTMAYNVQKLAKYLKKLEYMSLALDYCVQYNNNREQKRASQHEGVKINSGGDRLRMVPRKFGVLAWCLPGFVCKSVDAQDYYQQKVEKLQQKLDKERKSLRSKPLGIAFIVLPSFHVAKRVVDDFKMSANRNLRRMPPHHQHDLGAEFWNVKLSPPKKDIIWENLQNIGPTSFLRGCLVNFLYVVLFIFVSTPAVLLAWFETFDRSTAGIRDKAVEKSSLLGFMIPPLLFVSVAVFMPYLIFLLDDLRSHWKLSTFNLRVMTKTYIYLLFMVVILPSIGLTSIYKFIDSVVLKSEKVRWDCMFLIDNGAFFTNYVITASLGGLCMELMRVTDLILYAFRLLMMKSKAERKAAIKNTLLEFPYGFMYAYQLTVMTTVIAYSIMCPLITPFGVIYMLIRHFVDRYNIYFSYAPSRISQNCHYRAVNFVILSSVVMLMTLLAFSWIRFGKGNGNTVFLIVCACLLGLYLIGKHVVKIMRNFQSSSTATSDSVDCSKENTLQSPTYDVDTSPTRTDHNEENLGEITRFECPFLTFKPTWLTRHASATTPRLTRACDSSRQRVETASCSSDNLLNKNEGEAGTTPADDTQSFSFDIPITKVRTVQTELANQNTIASNSSLATNQNRAKETFNPNSEQLLTCEGNEVFEPSSVECAVQISSKESADDEPNSETLC